VRGTHEARIQDVLNGLDSGMRAQQLRLMPFVSPGRCTATIVSGEG